MRVDIQVRYSTSELAAYRAEGPRPFCTQVIFLGKIIHCGEFWPTGLVLNEKAKAQGCSPTEVISSIGIKAGAPEDVPGSESSAPPTKSFAQAIPASDTPKNGDWPTSGWPALLPSLQRQVGSRPFVSIQPLVLTSVDRRKIVGKWRARVRFVWVPTMV